MKYYYIKSAEGIRFVTAAADKVEAENILLKAFEKGDYWGYKPEKICEIPELPVGLRPEPGQVMKASIDRI